MLEIAAGGFGSAYDKPKKSGPCGLGLCGIGLNAGWAVGRLADSNDPQNLSSFPSSPEKMRKRRLGVRSSPTMSSGDGGLRADDACGLRADDASGLPCVFNIHHWSFFKPPKEVGELTFHQRRRSRSGDGFFSDGGCSDSFNRCMSQVRKDRPCFVVDLYSRV